MYSLNYQPGTGSIKIAASLPEEDKKVEKLDALSQETIPSTLKNKALSNKVIIRLSPGEKWGVATTVSAFALGILALGIALLSVYGAAHGMHPSFLSHLPGIGHASLSQIASGAGTIGGGLMLIGLVGTSILKAKKSKTEEILADREILAEIQGTIDSKAFLQGPKRLNPTNIRYVVIQEHKQLPASVYTYQIFSNELQAKKAHEKLYPQSYSN